MAVVSSNSGKQGSSGGVQPVKRTKGSRKERYAFTLVELLVVVAIIALLISILLPTLVRVEEIARQTMCMTNLKGISTGWLMYTSANNGRPPILPDIDQDVGVSWGGDLQMGDKCLAYGADGLGTGAQQNLCLLVKLGAVDWDSFLCPSSGRIKADRGGSGRKYGFGETAGGVETGYCDYAIQAPYRTPDGGNWNRCPITRDMDGQVIILADRGPIRWYYLYGISDWSQNHPEHGESILYVAGNVRFSRDEVHDDSKWGDVRNTSGWGGNCIYTADMWTNPESDNPQLDWNGHNSAGFRGLSTKDTVLFWWPEE